MSRAPGLAEAAARIRRGELLPTELVYACLERIDQLDGRLRAWVMVDRDGARQTAEQLSREAASGWFRGPLHGVPIGIKDIIDVEHWPTKAGSPLRENHVAGADAPVVAALRHAGAIILGKTVTVEFACFDPSPSRNPWDRRGGPAHTPGGSSSGSAVAVAVGMCSAALGTQTGGSLVRPSSYCGVATCKPTFGRVDRDGVVPVSYHFDHVGPIARRVADLELLLDCLPWSRDWCPPGDAGVCGELAPTAAAAVPSSAHSAIRQADHVIAKPPTLGILGGYFERRSDAAVRTLTAATVDKLRAAGAIVQPVAETVDFDQVLPLHRRIMGVEAAAYHRDTFARARSSYGPMITGLLDEGLATSAVDYAAALDALRQYRRDVVRLFEGVDALVAPSTHTTAPPTLETTGTPEFQAPWSLAGVPVVSIPCGLDDQQMPAAVQIVGPHHADRRVLAVAAWCEAAIGFDAQPHVS